MPSPRACISGRARRRPSAAAHAGRDRSLPLADGEKCHTHIALLPGDRCGARARAHARADPRRSDRSRLRGAAHAGVRGAARAGGACTIRRAWRRSAASRRRDRIARASLRHDPAGADPRELRHAARARRRHGDAQHRLPAGAGRRVSRRRGRPVAVDGGQFQIDNAALGAAGSAGRRTPRTINMSTIGHALLDEARRSMP
jgi:hypothetical protein